MQLSWTPGYDGNLPITEYTLQIKENSVGPWSNGRTHAVIGTNIFTIPNLRPGGRYYCRVKARNRLGYGPYSENEILSTEEEGNEKMLPVITTFVRLFYFLMDVPLKPLTL